MAKTDRAAETAAAILDGMICECGHTDSEHLMFTDTTKCGEKRCRCAAFRPVKFTVVRT